MVTLLFCTDAVNIHLSTFLPFHHKHWLPHWVEIWINKILRITVAKVPMVRNLFSFLNEQPFFLRPFTVVLDSAMRGRILSVFTLSSSLRIVYLTMRHHSTPMSRVPAYLIFPCRTTSPYLASFWWPIPKPPLINKYIGLNREQIIHSTSIGQSHPCTVVRRPYYFYFSTFLK